MKMEIEIKGLFAKIRADISNSVVPCLNKNNITGGYYSVPLIIFSFIEYLGVLWKNPVEHKKNKVIKYYSCSHFPDEAIPYIRKYLASVRPEYKKYGGLLYGLYRHSLVHHFKPTSIILKNGKIISWGIMKSSREQHLSIIESSFYDSKEKFIKCRELTINLEIFYQDLMKSIDDFEIDVLESPSICKRVLRAEKKLNASRPEDTLQKYIKVDLKYFA
jgi:hypothetical protein